MNITLWGVRGSIPTSTPQTKRYGGNTSCVEINSGDWQVILDAGTGIQNLNFNETKSRERIDILLTHLHMDHIQGLGFFQPLFDRDTEVHIWGPESSTQSLRARIGKYFSPPLFPVYFRNLTCQLFIHEIQDSSFSIGPFDIESNYILHPGPTLGFRVKEGNHVLAYIPDHEPVLGRSAIIKDRRWLSGSDLAHQADILIHDAQYTAEEYADRSGWGHCSMIDSIAFAEFSEVRHLVMTHHDPMRTDRELDELVAELRRNLNTSFTFELAIEGSQFVL